LYYCDKEITRDRNKRYNKEMNEIDYMKAALDEARLAFSEEEIPVGAVIVKDGKIISCGRNTNRMENCPTRHAEINAIEKAAGLLGNERLNGCTLYVTKEPCAMCAGAIVHSRVARLVIGAPDTRYGACGTVMNICGNKIMNHIPEIVFGVLEDECSDLIKKFFQNLRGRKGF
jgi:tRNA(adenine34) deaminase